MKTLVVLVLAGCGAQAEPIVNHAQLADPHASRDDVLRATFAALSAGDREQLVALAAALEVAERSLDCTPEHREAMPAHFGDAPNRERFETIAGEARGVSIDLVAVESDETLFRAGRQNATEPDSNGLRYDWSVRAGEDVGRCTAKLDVLVHATRVKVRVPDGERIVPVALLEIGGRWYLSNVVSGSLDGRHVEAHAKARAKTVEFRDRMCGCDDRRCAVRVESDWQAWQSVATPSEYGIDERLEQETREIEAEGVACFEKLTKS